MTIDADKNGQYRARLGPVEMGLVLFAFATLVGLASYVAMKVTDLSERVSRIEGRLEGSKP